MENLLEDVSFNAGGDSAPYDVVIDENYVSSKLGLDKKSKDLKKYII